MPILVRGWADRRIGLTSTVGAEHGLQRDTSELLQADMLVRKSWDGNAVVLKELMYPRIRLGQFIYPRDVLA